MGKLALSLDTLKLKWGITPSAKAVPSKKKEIKSADQVIASVTKNQLKKRRSSGKKKRR